MEEFELFIKNNLPIYSSFHPHYDKSLQEMFFAGGKRFRPALLLSVVNAYQPLLKDGAYYAAMALESLHTYSLIHDDLPDMDDANLRRGVQTLHKQYDNTTAILAGDALNTYAFELLSKAPLSAEVRIRLVKVLAESGGAGGMVLGQAIDCHFEGQKLSLEQLIKLHENKTGKLIAASLQMGAIIVENRLLEKTIYDFGLKIGLLFQVQDDILDIVQSDEDAGKSTNNDENKNSFVTLLGLEEAIIYANNLAKEIEELMLQFDKVLQDSLNNLLQKYIYRHKGF